MFAYPRRVRMRVRLHASRSQGSGAGWYWVLALAVLGAVAWVVWHNTRVQPQTQARKPVPAFLQPTNRPPVTPALPVTPLPSVPATTAGLSLRPVRTMFEAQVALARRGICSGSIDGALGSQTRAALRVYQQLAGLPVTGELDAATRARLTFEPPATTPLVVTASDLLKLQPVSRTWLGKSQQSALEYENILELAAEAGHAHPALVRRLNPAINWSNVVAGTTIEIPRVDYPPPRKAAWLRIRLGEKTLQAFDARTNLLAHFPCSIAARVEKRPVGELRVAVIAPNPNYTFDPDIFPESAEGRALGRKLVLPPGPNNPVGVAWIGLDRPGYGIHGTPAPENVGRTESHGCFRLANWNAEYLVRLVAVGTPVLVE